MCSIDGAWLAPMPPITLAMCASALTHLLPDLRQRRVRDAGELDHHVDRHAAPPQADPVAPAHEVLLLVREAELVHPRFLVASKQLALLRVLERVRRLVQPHPARRRLLVEEVQLR